MFLTIVQLYFAWHRFLQWFQLKFRAGNFPGRDRIRVHCACYCVWPRLTSRLLIASHVVKNQQQGWRASDKQIILTFWMMRALGLFCPRAFLVLQHGLFIYFFFFSPTMNDSFKGLITMSCPWALLTPAFLFQLRTVPSIVTAHMHAKVVARDAKEMRNTQDTRPRFVSCKSGRFWLFLVENVRRFSTEWK